MLKLFIASGNKDICKQIAKCVVTTGSIEIEYITDKAKDLLAVIYEPDICIIDCDLLDNSRLEAVKDIRKKHINTDIILVASSNNFISKAIELYAIDYIIKPISLTRLINTFNVIKNRRLLQDCPLEIKTSNGEIMWLRESDIFFIEAMGRKTQFYVHNGVYTANMPLNKVEKKLCIRSFFFKSSRSYILNLAKIKKVVSRTRTSLFIVFDNYHYTAILSKNKLTEFQNKINSIKII